MTRTFHIIPSTPRAERLARAHVSSQDAARIDALGSREARRADLAGAMAHATVRAYSADYYHESHGSPCGEPERWTNPDWTIAERDRERNYR